MSLLRRISMGTNPFRDHMLVEYNSSQVTGRNGI